MQTHRTIASVLIWMWSPSELIVPLYPAGRDRGARPEGQQGRQRGAGEWVGYGQSCFPGGARLCCVTCWKQKTII